jgi:hypothetical protein
LVQAHGDLLQIRSLLLCLAETGKLALLSQFPAHYGELLKLCAHSTCPQIASECIEVGKLLISDTCTDVKDENIINLRAACRTVLDHMMEHQDDMRQTVMLPLLIRSAVTGLFQAATAQQTRTCEYLHDNVGLRSADMSQLMGSKHCGVRRASWKALLEMLTSGEWQSTISIFSNISGRPALHNRSATRLPIIFVV